MVKYLLLLLTSSALNAQATYRAGYLIDNAGERKNILINDRDWVDNPRAFTYQSEGSEGNKNGRLEEVAEFGFNDGSRRFVRYTLDIDQSSDQDRDLSFSSKPEYALQTVFLDVLVDGAADLYYWEKGEQKRYFYRLGEADPVQLVSRRYRDGPQAIRRDDSFRGMLRQQLRCGFRQDKQLQQLPYDKKSLVAYFAGYNSCEGSPSVVVNRQPSMDRLSLGAKVGMERATMSLTTFIGGGFGLEFDFPQSNALRYGAEVEYRLPFAGNRWATYSGAYYHRFRGQHTDRFERTTNMYYRAVNVPLGVRRYIYVKDKSSVFLNGQVSVDIPVNAKVTQVVLTSTTKTFPPTYSTGFELGGGVSFADRYQLEVLSCLGRSVTDAYPDRPSKYTYTAVMATYRIGKRLN